MNTEKIQIVTKTCAHVKLIDLPNILRWIPTFASKFTAMRIINGWVQNTDTEITVLQNEAVVLKFQISLHKKL